MKVNLGEKLMLWSEIKKWAKEKGYETVKQKDDSVNGHSYYWSKVDDPQVSGISLSVSKLAKDIYNSITNNKWTEHQAVFQESKAIGKFNVSDY
jgi:hypothetical protein